VSKPVEEAAMTLRRIFLLAIWLFLPSRVLAAHIDLAWNPNSEPDLAGYIVYYGTAPREYTDWIDVGNVTSARIKGLPHNKEYFFAVTAYDFYGNESDFSEEVSGLALPGDDPVPPADNGSSSVGGGSSSGGGGCFIATATHSRPQIPR
jgi:hypothetical protein